MATIRSLDAQTLKAIAEVQRVMAEKQQQGAIPTSRQMHEVTEQLRRHNRQITTAFSQYEAALGSMQVDQLDTIQKAVDQLTRTIGAQLPAIPLPPDAAWVQTLSRRLRRTTPIPIAEEIPGTLQLVSTDQVDADALNEFESEFVSGDEETRQALDEGTSWIAKTRDVSLEVARLSLLTLVFLQLSIALGVLLVATPELTSWILAVSGVNVVDLTKGIAKFAEGDRDQ
ncbi:hypothetical protein [Rhodococcus sp. 14-2483-1-2]|uniref:hypothetical protein n=1 Tax=Rhodococcus sp. 14-2483-1-2 TaxID=2023147 RepID=UPI0011406595|nr:hypothetical protein [Rhodococcus sp. 14-2483-1-2]